MDYEEIEKKTVEYLKNGIKELRHIARRIEKEGIFSADLCMDCVIDLLKRISDVISYAHSFEPDLAAKELEQIKKFHKIWW